jgi:hypothetical protein
VCVISAKSNTGSIADVTGQEYLGNRFEWNIVFQPQNTPHLNLQYEKINDRDYKLTWDKPDPNYGEVDYYIVSTNYETSNPIHDTSYSITLPENTYSYVYVRAYFKESFLNPLEDYVVINNFNY